MEKKPTQSRKRESRGSKTLWRGQGAAPLVEVGATPQLFHGRPVCQARSTKGAGSEASLPVTLRSRRSAPKRLYPLLAHCRAKWARPHSRSTTPCPCFSPTNGYPTPKGHKKNQRHKTAGFFNSPEIFTFSAPPDESAGTSARSPQTRTSWGAAHAARDSAPTGRSKAECSAPATIG